MLIAQNFAETTSRGLDKSHACFKGAILGRHCLLEDEKVKEVLDEIWDFTSNGKEPNQRIE